MTDVEARDIAITKGLLSEATSVTEWNTIRDQSIRRFNLPKEIVHEHIDASGLIIKTLGIDKPKSKTNADKNIKVEALLSVIIGAEE